MSGKKKNKKRVEKVDSLYIRVYWSLEPIGNRAVATVRSPQQGALNQGSAQGALTPEGVHEVCSVVLVRDLFPGLWV